MGCDIWRCRMIYLRSKYDIISVLLYAKRISSLKERYHTEGISPVPTGTDIIEKERQVFRLVFLFLGPTLKMEPVEKFDFLYISIYFIYLLK